MGVARVGVGSETRLRFLVFHGGNQLGVMVKRRVCVEVDARGSGVGDLFVEKHLDKVDDLGNLLVHSNDRHGFQNMEPVHVLEELGFIPLCNALPGGTCLFGSVDDLVVHRRHTHRGIHVDSELRSQNALEQVDGDIRSRMANMRRIIHRRSAAVPGIIGTGLLHLLPGSSNTIEQYGNGRAESSRQMRMRESSARIDTCKHRKNAC